MEAGYDYLLLRSRLQQSFIRVSAMFLAITGAILLTAGIAYFVYAELARSGLGELNYTVTTVPGASIETIPASSASAVAVQVEQAFIPSLPSAPIEGGDTLPVITLPELTLPVTESRVAPIEIETVAGSEVVVQAPQAFVIDAGQALQALLSEATGPQISPSAIAAQHPYPGEAIKATYWSNPLEYEPASYVESSLIQGFVALDPSQLMTLGTLPAPTRIIIPSIGVDSDVMGLEILDLGDSRAYDTPKHVVGHIPQSANPGERGSTWLFGHLESPIAREGNVFYNLPKVPDLLRKGQEVYTIVENGTSSYLYRITETKVIHQDDIQLFDSGGPLVHMVVCVPRFVYDHRLIVTGELVGIRT